MTPQRQRNHYPHASPLGSPILTNLAPWHCPRLNVESLAQVATSRISATALSRCQAQICGQYLCRSSNTIQSAATSLSTRLIAIVSFRGCARCQSPCLLCSNAHRKRYPDSEVTCLSIIVDKGRRALCSPPMAPLVLNCGNCPF